MKLRSLLFLILSVIIIFRFTAVFAESETEDEDRTLPETEIENDDEERNVYIGSPIITPPVNAPVNTPQNNPDKNTSAAVPAARTEENIYNSAPAEPEAAAVVLPAENNNITPDGAEPAAPASSLTVKKPLPWAWIITRSAGIASYVLLALITVTGISLTTGLLYRLFSPAAAWSAHRAIGSALLVSIVIHVGALLFDRYINIGLMGTFVPFTSAYRPSLVAFGTIGFYLLLLVLSTSLYVFSAFPKFWRTIHFFAFPMFALIFLHGVLIGTDSKQLWMKVIYWTTALIVGYFVAYRMYWKYHQPVQAQL